MAAAAGNVAGVQAQTIAQDLQFEMNNTINCSNCFGWCRKKPKIVYVNHNGEIEPYSPKKGKGMEEHIKSAQRIEQMIRERLKGHTNEVEEYMQKVKKKGHMYFALWDQGETQITLNHIEEINRVLEEIAFELAKIKVP